MVLAILFGHGGYNNQPDVTVPYNIRLITYTNPSTDLGPTDLVFILRQLLGLDRFENETGLKDNILEIEQNDSTVEIISPPYTKWKPRTKFRKPQGKFTIYEPKSKTSNLYLRIDNDSFRTKYSPYLETKLVYELNTLTQPIRYNSRNGNPLPKQKSKILYKGTTLLKNLGEWLKEISCFYEKEFPGKIINVIQLSCRHTDETAKYTSVDELALDLENKLNLSGPLEGPATAELPPPNKYGIIGPPSIHSGMYEYDYPAEYDIVYKDAPLILTKSKDVDIPASSGCQVGTGGKRLKTKRKSSKTKKSKRKTSKTKKSKRKTKRNNKYKKLKKK